MERMNCKPLAMARMHPGVVVQPPIADLMAPTGAINVVDMDVVRRVEVGRQLGMPIATFEVAHTFAEIEAELGK